MTAGAMSHHFGVSYTYMSSDFISIIINMHIQAGVLEIHTLQLLMEGLTLSMDGENIFSWTLLTVSASRRELNLYLTHGQHSSQQLL